MLAFTKDRIWNYEFDGHLTLLTKIDFAGTNRYFNNKISVSSDHFALIVGSGQINIYNTAALDVIVELKLELTRVSKIVLIPKAT